LKKVSFLSDNYIKEYLSTRYIQALANISGFCSSSTDDVNDFGCDIRISSIEKNTYQDNSQSYNISGYCVDLQLKATTFDNFNELTDGNEYSYQLRLKNYNDIISRKKKKNSIPLYLIIFVCPEKIDDFLCINDKNLALKGEAYYWFPNDSDKEIYDRNRAYKKTIHVLKNNKIDINFFHSIFDKEFGNL